MVNVHVHDNEPNRLDGRSADGIIKTDTMDDPDNMTVRLGVIGAGSMGSSLAATLTKGVAWGRVVCVCDPSKEQGTTLAKKLGASWYADYHKILEDRQVDAVIIATPTNLHHEITLDALQHGKHVLCEKPLAENTNACDEMIRAAHEVDCQLMVGHCRRFNSKIQKMFQIVKSENMGAPRAVICRRTHAVWGYPGWRTDRSMHGGFLFEVAIHEIDLVCEILGNPIQVKAESSGIAEHGMENLVSVLVQFSEGRFANMIYGARDPWAASSFEVHCETGALRLLYAPKEGVEKRIVGSEMSEFEWTIPNNMIAEEVKAFCVAIASGNEVPVPGSIGRRAVAVAQAATKSYECGSAVQIAEIASTPSP